MVVAWGEWYGLLVVLYGNWLASQCMVLFVGYFIRLMDCWLSNWQAAWLVNCLFYWIYILNCIEFIYVTLPKYFGFFLLLPKYSIRKRWQWGNVCERINFDIFKIQSGLDYSWSGQPIYCLFAMFSKRLLRLTMISSITR